MAISWFAPRLTTGPARAVVTVIVGVLSGLGNIYVADPVVGIKYALSIGSVAGAITGLFGGALSPSAHKYHGNATKRNRTKSRGNSIRT